MRSAAFMGWVLAVLAARVMSASTETLVALVVGNSTYQTSPLADPVNDATAISASLARVGVTVKTRTNAKCGGMRRAPLEFARQAGSSDLAVVFFAGHGEKPESRAAREKGLQIIWRPALRQAGGPLDRGIMPDKIVTT